jgi:WD40 repeat protein
LSLPGHGRGRRAGLDLVYQAGEARLYQTSSLFEINLAWPPPTPSPSPVVSQATILRTLLSHTSHVLCITFNPKGNVLVTGGWDESVIFWNVRSGEKMRTLQAHSDPVTAVGYNVDGTMIVTGSYDGLMWVSRA